MDCPICGTEAEIFMTEPIECMHCGEYTYIDYNRCTECNVVFKAVGEKIDEDSIMKAPEDFLNTLDDVMSMAFSEKPESLSEEEFQNFIQNIGDDVEITELRPTKESSMSSMIHKCLKCQAVAYETKEGNYRCTDCGFEWEVVDFG